MITAFSQPLTLASELKEMKKMKSVLRFGMVTDAHYADKEKWGTRFYRESVRKMRECIEFMNQRRVDFLIELGDFKDEDTPPLEHNTLKYLDTIEAVFQQADARRYHVLGNHDLDSLSKSQFLSRIRNSGFSRALNYYSFDINGVHLIVLDANYRSDGLDYDHGNFDWKDSSLPPEQIRWLKKDLAAAHGPVIVFVHQQLYGEDRFTVKNAAAVRTVLEESGQVLAVFQGHHHSGGYELINRIHYYTLKALVDGGGAENNAYAVVDVNADNSLVITGYRRAESRDLNRPAHMPRP